MRLLVCIFALLLQCGLAAPSLPKPNVLFLCVDDWNDWVGCLGDGSIKTPNMDLLAARGTLFTNAHCAAPVCNPSRAAVMSGLRPFESGVYENGSPLQLALPEGRLTIPQYFRKHGYLSHGSGKIYHDQIGFNFPEDWDHYFLWNESYRRWAWECGYSRPPDPQPDPRPFAKITRKTKRNFDFAPLGVPDSTLPDFKSTTYGVEFLGQEHEQPFFLAVGQFKPHIPWFAPQEYFDLYPLDEIETPPVLANDIDDLPAIAQKRAVDRNSKHDQVVELGEWKKAIQGYKACISFADAQIGRVIGALDAGPHKDNTIVVLWSDHGYHLGEKGHWHKRTLWERSTRVPLIVVAPGVAEPATTCDNPVDLMALYPTLAELAGLPPIEGQSLVPMLRAPEQNQDTVALTSHTPGNHAVRSHTHRYIRYADGSEELYDHRDDPNEWHNLAGKDGSEPVMAALRKHLPESEVDEAPDYYKGTALIRLDGDTYDWKRKQDAKGDPDYVNGARLKSQAWKAAAEDAKSEPPNIVLILADDLGYSDLGCYGGEIQTPNLDQLAADGLRFERFYNAGRCCPTRASLLTGQFPHQAGIGHMNYDAGEPGYRGNLNKDTATIAEALKTAGYTTGMAGKWHVTPHTKPDGDRSNWPRQRGFDHFYGTLPGHGSLWDPAGLYLENEPVKAGDDYFYTDAIADDASAFIRESAKGESPFFLYVAFTAPHYPLHAREETIAKYNGVYDIGWDALREKRFKRLKKLGLLPDHAKLPPRDEGSIPWEDDPNKKWQAQRMQTFAAMVDEMDQAIGQILASLESTDAADNTLVVFLSDNGGSPEGHLNNTIERLEKPWTSSLTPKTTPEGKAVTPGDIPGLDLGGAHTYGSYGLRWSSVSNTPFRRHKAWMHEGGIAAPCIVRWPGKVAKPGSITRDRGHIIDLMPTFLDLAGAEHPKQETPLAGKSLRPVIEGSALYRDLLAWEHEGNRAIRMGKWKLVSEFPGTWKYFYPYEKRGDWELYDLEVDPTELNDLAPTNPEKVKGLERHYDEWAKKSLVVPWNRLEKKQI